MKLILGDNNEGNYLFVHVSNGNDADELYKNMDLNLPMKYLME